MKPYTVAFLLAASLALADGVFSTPAFAASGQAFPFFALCMDTHDSAQRGLEEQAALLRELGYDGAGHLWVEGLKERLRTLDAAGLKLFQVYLRVNISPDATPYDPGLKDALPLLEGRGVQLAVLLGGGAPSDTTGDDRAVAIIREIAGMAHAHGVSVALYPHAGDWLERVEDALRIAQKVDRPNVGVMFNLCHWLKVDEEEHLKPLLTAAMPHLLAVSINGADHAADIHAGKGNWIQPLGRGSFDIFALLETLRDLGYHGPVGLQCYGIAGDARDHLTASMTAWRELNARLAKPARQDANAEGERDAEMTFTAQQNTVIELAFRSSRQYDDPYNDVDLDVLFTPPDGPSFRVPAFWAGDNVWKVRFAGDKTGDYRFETSASVEGDAGLHQQAGAITVGAYTGVNPLPRHGRIRVAADRRHFEYADGAPFFWVGDTWWMGLTTRLDWPQGFKELAADRVAKGFNTIQIIAGPYPDMDAWDTRGANEAGYPFAEGFARINPAYYDHADLKIGHLVQSGLMPCIVGMWGYYLPQIGVEKIERFWRYLVARYGAYPVVWCICGEGTMPWYLSEARDADAAAQKHGWTEIMAFVREIDGYHNLITIHPTQYGREQVDDPSLMDFEMLQTGHGDLDSVPSTIDSVRTAVGRTPVMPVINAEVNYEGILGRAWQNVQRLCFYHSVLNGTAGHTYGANGIWQMSTRAHPYGPSPHGNCWGNTPWQEAAQLPGSRQVGLGGAFVRRFPWWECARHPEWVNASGKENDPYGPVATGIPRKLRILYLPLCWGAPRVKGIEADVPYAASYFDPCTGADFPLGEVRPDAEGNWSAPLPPEVHDWLLVLEAR